MGGFEETRKLKNHPGEVGNPGQGGDSRLVVGATEDIRKVMNRLIWMSKDSILEALAFQPGPRPSDPRADFAGGSSPVPVNV
jgi:hypothetical protein